MSSERCLKNINRSEDNFFYDINDQVLETYNKIKLSYSLKKNIRLLSKALRLATPAFCTFVLDA